MKEHGEVCNITISKMVNKFLTFARQQCFHKQVKSSGGNWEKRKYVNDLRRCLLKVKNRGRGKEADWEQHRVTQPAKDSLIKNQLGRLDNQLENLDCGRKNFDDGV